MANAGEEFARRRGAEFDSLSAMSKTFRSWDLDQSWLLPTLVHEFVPPGHLANFVPETVREALALSAIFQAYPEERGQRPYHPGMLVALLLYGYSLASIPAANSPVPAKNAWILWP